MPEESGSIPCCGKPIRVVPTCEQREETEFPFGPRQLGSPPQGFSRGCKQGGAHLKVWLRKGLPPRFCGYGPDLILHGPLDGGPHFLAGRGAKALCSSLPGPPSVASSELAKDSICYAGWRYSLNVPNPGNDICPLFHIQLTRSKAQVLFTLEGRRLYEAVRTRECADSGSHLRVSYLRCFPASLCYPFHLQVWPVLAVPLHRYLCFSLYILCLTL